MKMTNRPIGIITWDLKSLVPLLRDCSGAERSHFLTVGDLPEWEKASAYRELVGWSNEQMAQELAARLREAFGVNGVFNDAGEITTLPILDLLTFARTALQ
ncbi:hypothetical protein QF000_000561 [Paraburkholderia atlantica]|uniref:hypothetical protein n=1 Tax=Paraburkholderia atlantica TaxID=2654982 RepID=UPI003D1D0E47